MSIATVGPQAEEALMAATCFMLPGTFGSHLLSAGLNLYTTFAEFVPHSVPSGATEMFLNVPLRFTQDEPFHCQGEPLLSSTQKLLAFATRGS